ncbi:MAG TPA: ABC transporter permease [Acidimicrobiia bacterium]|jgi:ABC-2 type transport system permease protein/oleandomycin transport system permease protein
MTATTLDPTEAVDALDLGSGAERRGVWMLRDGLTVTYRNLLGYLRVPEMLFFTAIQPVMFVLLFRYVFGGAIPTPGYSYVDYLMPGIFVQTAAFAAMATSIGLAEDLQKGLVERFRTLPMARSAVLVGRTSADGVRNLFVLALLTVVGLAVGFRPQTNALAYLAGIALIAAFAYALTWGAAAVGLGARTAETAQLKIMPVLFPLTFASSAFVPVSTMPGWLQPIAEHQPVTIVVDAARALMLGGPTARPVLEAIAWIAGLLVVLVPYAVRKYRQVA